MDGALARVLWKAEPQGEGSRTLILFLRNNPRGEPAGGGGEGEKSEGGRAGRRPH